MAHDAKAYAPYYDLTSLNKPTVIIKQKTGGSDNLMIELEWIIQSVKSQAYHYSRHGDKERQNDALTLTEVEQAILNGRIIEQYPDTGRGESCLLVGFTDGGIPIHLVCSGMEALMVIITVYIPTPPKFINPYQRGNNL